MVNFSKEILKPKVDEASGKAALNALVLTLSQFTGVTNARVLVEGKDSEKFLGNGVRN